MRAKTALVSGLLSMLCAIPAFAARTTPAGHYVQHSAAAGVICGDPSNDFDVTTTWSSQNLHYKFNVNIPAFPKPWLVCVWIVLQTNRQITSKWT